MTTAPKAVASIFAPVESYPVENPYRAKLEIALQPLPDATNGPLPLTITRLSKGVYFAQSEKFDSAAFGTVRNAVSAVVKLHGMKLAEFAEFDFKALPWPALADARKAKAQAIAEGDNDKDAWAVDAELNAALNEQAERLTASDAEIGEGSKRVLSGWYVFASAYSKAKALISATEPDAERAKASFGRWATLRFEAAPEIAEKMVSKNAPSKLALMAGFPLSLCEALGVNTPSMLEKHVLAVRNKYIPAVRDVLVVKEGDIFVIATESEGNRAATAKDCEKALLDYIAALATSSAAKFAEVCESNAKKAAIGTKISAAEYANVDRYRIEMQDCEVLGVVYSDDGRLAFDGKKVFDACTAKAAALDTKAKEKEKEADEAEAKVVAAFEGMDTDAVAAYLLQMILHRADYVEVAQALADSAEDEAAEREANATEGDTGEAAA